MNFGCPRAPDSPKSRAVNGNVHGSFLSMWSARRESHRAHRGAFLFHRIPYRRRDQLESALYP
jgi:hypothetical protein